MIVGITGGIGSGKSTVAHLYELMGYPVYYADQRAKWLTNNSSEIKEQLISTFGKEVYTDQLNRQALASIAFSNTEALAKLNAIIHPVVNKDFKDWTKEQKSGIVFKEAAILFESGSHKYVDKTICVVAPVATRIMRVMKRDGISSKQVQDRINNQWTDEKKRSLSNYTIEADDQQLVIPQAIEILNQLKAL